MTYLSLAGFYITFPNYSLQLLSWWALLLLPTLKCWDSSGFCPHSIQWIHNSLLQLPQTAIWDHHLGDPQESQIHQNWTAILILPLFTTSTDVPTMYFLTHTRNLRPVLNSFLTTEESGHPADLIPKHIWHSLFFIPTTIALQHLLLKDTRVKFLKCKFVTYLKSFNTPPWSLAYRLPLTIRLGTSMILASVYFSSKDLSDNLSKRKFQCLLLSPHFTWIIISIWHSWSLPQRISAHSFKDKILLVFPISQILPLSSL